MRKSWPTIGTDLVFDPIAGAARLLRDFARDRDGAIAVIFIVALIPLLAAAGAAIDISRAYVVKQRLGYAVDAAGLAVGASTGTEDELQLVLERYFEANYPADEVGVPATPTMVIDGNNITVTADAEIDATLMRIMGVETIDVSAEALIVRKVTGLDVALVLDNSGSMAGSKISDLKSAATTFVNILFGDDSTSDTLQVGVVPFNATVNVGRPNGTYVRAGNGRRNSDYDPYRWEGCVEARDYPRDVEDSYTGTNRQKKWRRYLWVSNNNNDWPPDSGDRGQFRGPNKMCPVRLLQLTGTKQTVLDKIDDMDANGFTHINFGAAWGWRVVSPAEPFQEAHDYDDEEFNHAVVIMTDGENFMPSSSRDYTAYGFLQDGNLGTTSRSAAEDELDDRLLEVCTGMKAVGIIVYTITFDVDSSALRTLMRSCATSTANYFDSPSSSELQAAFEAIGAQLSNLRLGR
ncbi:MAG: pilus assembly protein [Alphaproteobacteria bacterium]